MTLNSVTFYFEQYKFCIGPDLRVVKRVALCSKVSEMNVAIVRRSVGRLPAGITALYVFQTQDRHRAGRERILQTRRKASESQATRSRAIHTIQNGHRRYVLLFRYATLSSEIEVVRNFTSLFPYTF